MGNDLIKNDENKPAKHPGGRPTKYQTAEGKKLPIYPFNKLKDLFNKASDFKSEKELCDYLELNIQVFCSEIGVNYKRHERESNINQFKPFGPNKPKIDFLIEDKDGSYVLIEVKKPRYQREVVVSLSQLLEYIVIAEEEGLEIKRSFLLTTKCEAKVIQIIQRFYLPIDLILFAKGNLAIWQKQLGSSKGDGR